MVRVAIIEVNTYKAQADNERCGVNVYKLLNAQFSELWVMKIRQCRHCRNGNRN
jgi:hypothetical protein